MWIWERQGRDIVLRVNDLAHEDFRAEVGRIKFTRAGFVVTTGRKRFSRCPSLASAVCTLGALSDLSFEDMFDAFALLNEIKKEERSEDEFTA